MFALPNPPLTVLAFVLSVSVGLIVVITFIVMNTVSRRRREHSTGDTLGASETRKCRYCRRGEAELRDETVRLDGEDLVGVRCYACSHCGLPQWVVERRGISPHVR